METCPALGRLINAGNSDSKDPALASDPNLIYPLPASQPASRPISRHTLHNEDKDTPLLPRIQAPFILLNGGADGISQFNLADIIGAIQQGESLARVQNYLDYHDTDGKGLPLAMNKNVSPSNYPGFFYIVETHNHELVRLWAKHGGDVDVCGGEDNLPLLAFALMCGGSYENDTRLVVTTLLSLGADVSCIPSAFYTPLARDLPASGIDQKDQEMFVTHQQQQQGLWLSQSRAKRIGQTLNFAFTTRAHLHLAALLPRRSGAERQVAKMRDATELLGISFFLIGQIPAAINLIDRLLGCVVGWPVSCKLQMD